MATLDAATLADRTVRLGLVTPHQVQEAWDELGKKTTDIEPFLKFMERKGYLTPFQTAKLRKDDKDGYILGGYRLLYRISSGSFGRVYRADDPRTGRVVAIKVLRRKWSEDKKSIEMFEREGRMGLTLKQPNIVETLAVSRDPATRQYFIVMEFVEGGNLRDILAIRKKMSPLETLRVLEECTLGMVYALARGVTHRDLKASNILLSSQGVAKLVDFGLAEVTQGPGAPTNEKDDDVDVARTVDYAGLEQATGVPAGDTRSDIFFLGCVGYQMLTSRFALDMPKSGKERMSRERFAKIPPISKEEAPAPLIRLIDNMVSLNANQRFQTPSQLLVAIREVRREIEGQSDPNASAAPVQRTVFIVEREEKLQNVMRDKFKEKGFRVLIAGDPARAMDRFRQQPFDLLIVNAMTIGEDGVFVLDKILQDAGDAGLKCAGVLLVPPDHPDWGNKLKDRPNQAVLVHPVKLKQLITSVQSLIGTSGE